MVRRALLSTVDAPDVTTLASVLADRSRIAMLDVLLDGRAHPIGTLARRIGVGASTASSHLARLVAARLVVVTRVGRERHVALASPEVAEVLERLAVLASGARVAPSLQLRFARTCYDHLAGSLGVIVTTSLVTRGWLHRTSDTFEPAPAMFEWLAAHAHAVPIAGPRALTRACVDWSERVPHVAGRIGAAIAQVFVAESWVARVRDTRGLRLTKRGRTAIAYELDVHFPS